MRKLIMIFFLLWKSVFVFSQIYLPVVPNDYGANFNRVKANLVLHLPVGDTSTLNTSDTSAQIRVVGGQLYYHSGYWRKAGGASTLQQVLDNGDSAVNQHISLTATGQPNWITINNTGFYSNNSITGQSTGFITGALSYTNFISNLTVKRRLNTSNTTLYFPSTIDNATFATAVRLNGTAAYADSTGIIDIGTLNVATPNLQAVTNIDSNTTHRINALGYDFKSNDAMTRKGLRFFYYDSTKRNMAIGAASNDTLASNSLAIGDSVLTYEQSGAGWNMGIGNYALKSNTTGQINLGIGYSSLNANTTGAGNEAFGYYGLNANTIGSNNTSVGYKAGSKATIGSFNTSLGSFAGYRIGTGSYNIAIGYASYQSSTGSFANLASGQHNIAMGYFALNEDSVGSFNIAIGRGAGTHNQSSFNTFIGDSTGFQIYNGFDNTIVGANAMILTNGHYDNTARNTVIGKNAGAFAGGSSNTIIGWSAGYGAFNGSHNIIIGDSVQFISGAIGDYQINIGNRVYSRDISHIGIMNNNPTYTLDVTGTGKFSDTLRAKTMGSTDSSIAVATTAFVKSQGYGGQGIIPVMTWAQIQAQPLVTGKLYFASDYNAIMFYTTVAGAPQTGISGWQEISTYGIASGLSVLKQVDDLKKQVEDLQEQINRLKK